MKWESERLQDSWAHGRALQLTCQTLSIFRNSASVRGMLFNSLQHLLMGKNLSCVPVMKVCNISSNAMQPRSTSLNKIITHFTNHSYPLWLNKTLQSPIWFRLGSDESCGPAGFVFILNLISEGVLSSAGTEILVTDHIGSKDHLLHLSMRGKDINIWMLPGIWVSIHCPYLQDTVARILAGTEWCIDWTAEWATLSTWDTLSVPQLESGVFPRLCTFTEWCD